MALHVYSINGKHMSYEILYESVAHMVVMDAHMVIGTTQGNLIVKEIFGSVYMSNGWVNMHEQWMGQYM